MENEDFDVDRRIQLVFRRRGQGAYDSVEIKTENYDNEEQMLLDITSIITCNFEEDREYLLEQLEVEA